MTTATRITTTDTPTPAARGDVTGGAGRTPTDPGRHGRRQQWIVALALVIGAAVLAAVVMSTPGPGGEQPVDQLDAHYDAYRSTLGDGAHEVIERRIRDLTEADADAQPPTRTDGLDDHYTSYRIVLRDGASTLD